MSSTTEFNPPSSASPSDDPLKYEDFAFMQYYSGFATKDWHALKSILIGEVDPNDVAALGNPAAHSGESRAAAMAAHVYSQKHNNLRLEAALEELDFFSNLVAATNEVHAIATDLRKQANDNPNDVAPANDPMLLKFAEQYNISVNAGEYYAVEEWEHIIQSILLVQDSISTDSTIATHNYNRILGDASTVIQLLARLLGTYGSILQSFGNGFSPLR